MKAVVNRKLYDLKLLYIVNSLGQFIHLAFWPCRKLWESNTYLSKDTGQ